MNVRRVKIQALILALGLVLMADPSFARKNKKKYKKDGYPYDRSVSECVQGDCVNGIGVYVYESDDIFQGRWRQGKRHGEGVYYFVKGRRWRDVHRRVGTWVNGKKHGKFTYRFPSGSVSSEHWYNDQEVTDRVRKCWDAKAMSDAYKGFVAIVNALVAGANDRPVLEGGKKGYDAAGDQMIPRAVDLTCDQLLSHFD